MFISFYKFRTLRKTEMLCFVKLNYLLCKYHECIFPSVHPVVSAKHFSDNVEIKVFITYCKILFFYIPKNCFLQIKANIIIFLPNVSYLYLELKFARSLFFSFLILIILYSDQYRK